MNVTRLKHVLEAVLIIALARSDAALSAPEDPWLPLRFLEGTWEARTTGGSAGAQSQGLYTFARELKGHVLARHTDYAGACQGPQAFDCSHSDIFYIYQEHPGGPLKAIYFDNEGHVIHYDVTVPDPETAVLESAKSNAAPQYRLVYQLHGSVMTGKFQIRMPSHADWTSYLEWSGAKQ